MKVLFFGTPDIAVPFLDWLHEHQTVTGVVCRPDKPVGRGYELTPPPVKVASQQKNMVIHQPMGPWTPETINALKKDDPEIGIVVAYGRIMPTEVFMTPKLGCLNIHFSLLPKYRGAAPMQWSLVNGENETGVTAFWLNEEMDAGPIFHQEKVLIEKTDSLTTLRPKLIEAGKHLLERIFSDLSSGNIINNPQQGEPTFAPIIKKQDGRLDWSDTAVHLVNRVRGFEEWPVAHTMMNVHNVPKLLKIQKAIVYDDSSAKKTPGEILGADADNGIKVQSGQGIVALKKIQPEGKKQMDGWAFWQGGQLKEGDKFQ